VALSWPFAVVNAYIGYRYIVFRSHGPMLRELPRFSLVYVASLIVNLALLPIALRVLPFNIYVDQALFLGVVVIGSYLGHKYYSFRGARSRDSLSGAQSDPEAVAEDQSCMPC
jgi:putative flippase GtrA